MKETPFLAVGNDELGEEVTDRAICPHCGELHDLVYGERVLADGTKEPCKMLGVVKCANGHLYLGSINGKQFRKPGV